MNDINATGENMASKAGSETSAPDIYAYEFKSLDGETMKLSQFKGKKILIVNTASECGYTPQYKQLQEVADKYKEQLVVIGFPTNDFGAQEPGSNKEIKSFCQKNYGVSFPMSEKITVKGSETPAIYKWLTSKSMNGFEDSQVAWNFQKYLIDENGHLVGVFKSAIKPDDKQITSLITAKR